MTGEMSHAVFLITTGMDWFKPLHLIGLIAERSCRISKPSTFFVSVIQTGPRREMTPARKSRMMGHYQEATIFIFIFFLHFTLTSSPQQTHFSFCFNGLLAHGASTLVCLPRKRLDTASLPSDLHLRHRHGYELLSRF